VVSTAGLDGCRNSHPHWDLIPEHKIYYTHYGIVDHPLIHYVI